MSVNTGNPGEYDDEQYEFNLFNEDDDFPFAELDELYITSSPTEILDFLYLGNWENSKDLDHLQKIGITHICNMAKEIKHEHDPRFKYLEISLEDVIDENISKYFDITNEHIDNVLKQNEKILVHCIMGISRSTTIVIAYLMNHFKLSLHEAYDFVKEKRPIISPNVGFINQLKDYELQLEIFDL